MPISLRSLVTLSLLALGCASTPPAEVDAGVTPGEDGGTAELDAGAVVGDDAGAMCPTPTAGRWLIRTSSFTYAGPDCRPAGIDGEYHPISFTVAADGSIGCECDTTPTTCSSSITGLGSNCETLLTCAGGASMYVTFVSPTTAEVREHRLVNGDCVASGTFTPE